MIEYDKTLEHLAKTPLASWALQLPQQIEKGLSTQRYGDLEKWLDALKDLPEIKASRQNLSSSVTVGCASDCTDSEREKLETQLQKLKPWRKGPFELFGINVDTEWRSDWKWERLLPHIAPLENKVVLDVGCGNGYHCWRMLGKNARQVIGIDPSPRFIVQFYMIKKFLPDFSADIFPVGIQDLPENLCAFDSTFSMGVLYHRRSPMDHLRQLKETLKPGGELVLETLIIDGKQGETLVPEGRYAKMNNVWFIPSVDTLLSWLRKSGFDNVRCVDVNKTTLSEQRITTWVETQSLQDFLDPNDSNLTVEGHPAPLRGIFIANRKK